MPSSRSGSDRSSKRRLQTSDNNDWEPGRSHYPQAHTRKEPEKYAPHAQTPCPGGMATCPDFAHVHGPRPGTTPTSKHCHFTPTAKILDMEFGGYEKDSDSNISTQAVFQGAAPYREQRKRVRSKDPDFWFQDKKDRHVPHDECWSHTGHQGSDVTNSSMNDSIPHVYRKSGTISPGGWMPVNPTVRSSARPLSEKDLHPEMRHHPKFSPLVPPQAKAQRPHVTHDQGKSGRFSATEPHHVIDGSRPRSSGSANASRRTSRPQSTVRSNSSDGDPPPHQSINNPLRAQRDTPGTSRGRHHQSDGEHRQWADGSRRHHFRQPECQYRNDYNYVDDNNYYSDRYTTGDAEPYRPRKFARPEHEFIYPGIDGHFAYRDEQRRQHCPSACDRDHKYSTRYTYPSWAPYCKSDDYYLPPEVRNRQPYYFEDPERFYERNRPSSRHSTSNRAPSSESGHFTRSSDPRIYNEPTRSRSRHSTTSKASSTRRSDRSTSSSRKNKHVSRIERFSLWLDDLLGAVFMDHTFRGSRPSSRAESSHSSRSRYKNENRGYTDEYYSAKPESPNSAYESRAHRSHRA